VDVSVVLHLERACSAIFQLVLGGGLKEQREEQELGTQRGCTGTARQRCVSQSKDRRKQRMFTSVNRNVSLSCSQTYTSLFTFGQNLIIRLPSHLSLSPWLAQGPIPSPERYTYLPFSPSTCPLAKVAQICVKKNSMPTTHCLWQSNQLCP
jgi:hypothetical protein